MKHRFEKYKKTKFKKQENIKFNTIYIISLTHCTPYREVTSLQVCPHNQRYGCVTVMMSFRHPVIFLSKTATGKQQNIDESIHKRFTLFIFSTSYQKQLQFLEFGQKWNDNIPSHLFIFAYYDVLRTLYESYFVHLVSLRL